MDYFIADTHGGHQNICKGVSLWEDKSGCRDFASTDEMDEKIIDSINEVVGPDDTLRHLGDFILGPDKLYRTVDFRKRIVCKNVYLVLGNHDMDIEKYDELPPGTFSKVYKDVTHKKFYLKDGRKISATLCHYAWMTWPSQSKGGIMLHGHSHGSLIGTENVRSLDVGWDVWKRPLSIDEVVDLINLKKIEKVDHHHG